MRNTLIIATFVAFILDFGIAAYLRSHAQLRTYKTYEFFSCLANTAVFGGWLLFGQLSTGIAFAVGFYAFTQAAGVVSCATWLSSEGSK